VRCHGAAKRKSGFRLDTREQFLKVGSERDQVIIEGHSDKSPHVLMAAGLIDDLEMPRRTRALLSPRDTLAAARPDRRRREVARRSYNS
jgi:hypothetical protein